MSKIYTIGHSNHKIEFFIKLLMQHNITAIGDVRSHPYSRYVPQYSQGRLKDALKEMGIKYVFLGKELGGRSENPNCYEQGRVQYERMAEEPAFLEGINRVIRGSSCYQIALMCSERDPINCHRALLIGRKLFERGISVNHILADASLETHADLESRLLDVCGLTCHSFKSREECIGKAYLIQNNRVGYKDERMSKNNE